MHCHYQLGLTLSPSRVEVYCIGIKLLMTGVSVFVTSLK